VIAPEYRVRIDFGGSIGYFIVGTSVVGGPDLIAPDGLLAPFSNANADVTGVVDSGTIQRILGSDGVVDGTLDLMLVDAWPGKYNPRNTASSIYGLVRPNLQCDVDVSFDSGATWHTIFVGWLDEVQPKNDYNSNVTVIKFRDNSKLDEPAQTIAATGAITVGAALELIHGQMGWKFGTDFAAGEALGDFSFTYDGSTSWRALITDLIKVDLGTYYISRDGVATYADRYEYARRSVAATVAVVTAQSPGIARVSIVNRATATMTGSTPQVVDAPDGGTSQGLYGIVEDQTNDVDSPWFLSDATAYGNAWWRAFVGASPRGKTWSISANSDDPTTLEDMILVDIRDQVTVSVPGLADFTEEAIQVNHSFGAGRAHTMTWRLQEIPTLRPFFVGSSLVGGTDVVVAG
jgi:hypothetical protein